MKALKKENSDELIRPAWTITIVPTVSLICLVHLRDEISDKKC